jgi:surface carbohydrate biosynthesis protein
MNIFSAISRLIGIKKNWRRPKKAKVLIFDVGRNNAYDQEFEKVLMPYSFEVLPLFEQELNIPVFLASLCIMGKLKKNYYDSYIRMVSPGLVVTYIDNNLDFYSFSFRHPKIKTLFIQNGVRGYFADIFEVLDKDKGGTCLSVDYMLTFGSAIGAEYSKYIKGQIVPIGSFRNNAVPVSKKKIKGTLAFVSQFRDTIGFNMGGIFYSFEKFWAAEEIIIPFLLEFANKKGLDFFIIPSTGHYKNPTLLEREKKYFNGIAGRECQFSNWYSYCSSYDAIDSAEVVVAVDSSLGLESIARGTKTAIFSIRSTLCSLLEPPFLNFGWPGKFRDAGQFWTNNPDLEVFKKILDHLYTVSEEDWFRGLNEERFADVLRYDPGNKIARDIISSELVAPQACT